MKKRFFGLVTLILTILVSCLTLVSCSDNTSKSYKYHRENIKTLSTIVDSSTAESIVFALETSCAIGSNTKLVAEDMHEINDNCYELYAGLMVRFYIQDGQLLLYTFETNYNDDSKILLYNSSEPDKKKVLTETERKSLVYTQRRAVVHSTLAITPREGTLLHNALGSTKIDLTFKNKSSSSIVYLHINTTPCISGVEYSYNGKGYVLNEDLPVGGSTTRSLTTTGWKNYDSYKITKATIMFADGSTIGFDSFDCQFLDGNGDSPDTILRDSQITYHLYDGQTEVQNFYSGFGASLITPYRYGYNFIGWYDNAEYNGTPIEKIDTGEQVSIELFAKWEGSKIVIQYDGNGNDGGITQEQIVQVGTTITLSKNGFTKNGFKFAGWTKQKDSYELIEEESLYDIPLNATTFTLYAQWEKEIESIEDFNLINSNDDCIYSLKNDLDFTGKGVVTIENFSGIFNGNGHVLKNSNEPLFISNNGEIKNLIIENCKIATYLNVEEYETTYGGMLIYNKGKIVNCSVLLEFNETVRNSCFGGICAFNQNGEISSSRVELNISCIDDNDVSTLTCWGGIVGYNHLGRITNSYVVGNIKIVNNKTTNGTAIIGGIAGESYSSIVENVYTNIEMDIQSTNWRYVGGIVGSGKNNTFNSCLFMGNISIINCYLFTLGGIQGGDCSYTYKINNCYSNETLNIPYYSYTGGGKYGENGIKIDATEFYKKNFYLDNDILKEYHDLETLRNDSNAVWIIVDGELPKLYWEKSTNETI